MKNKTPEVAYRYWQNHATPFYLAARILVKNDFTREAAAFCANQAIESLIKGALEYNKRKNQIGHLTKSDNKLREEFSKIQNMKNINIPNYFDDYYEPSRYPYSYKATRGSGLRITLPDFINDLDRIFFEIINKIPDKKPTRLYYLLTQNNLDLSENNKYYSQLKQIYKIQ